MAYLLDTNCFVEPKQQWYGLDFCPGFWSWLEQQNATGQLFSIDKVRDELCEFDDDLKAWALLRGDGFFLPVDAESIAHYSRIANWLQNESGLAQQHITSFLSKADPWLIAYASEHGHTVVSMETMVDATSRKVKIPNVCQQFSVPCTRLFPVIRLSGAKLELR